MRFGNNWLLLDFRLVKGPAHVLALKKLAALNSLQISYFHYTDHRLNKIGHDCSFIICVEVLITCLLTQVDV